jgi:hypothetical protein
MTSPSSRMLLLCLLTGGSACTGLIAGPESQSVTAVPASRDSAYVRARRGLTGESFTMDVVDSAGGRLTATRWPSSSGKLGSSQACHVSAALEIKGDAAQSEVSATTRWIAPGGMQDKAPTVCEQERNDVLSRLAQTLAPPPTP